MPLPLAVWFVRLAYLYGAAGVLLVPWWHIRGLQRLDDAAAPGPWGFRLLITPGLIALWPWLLAQTWRRAGEPPAECNAHRKLARAATTP